MSNLLTPTLPTLWLEGFSLIAPGMPNWSSALEILRGEKAYQPATTQLPAPELLPAAERRRATRPVKLSLGLGIQACEQAGTSPATLPSVFCSSGADGQTTHAICDTLSMTERMVSPTRFHNSVHNAAAGYWGVAVQCMAPSQVICAHDATFAAGLIETLAQVHARQVPVLLIAYDGEYPEPLSACRPIPDVGGIGLVLSPVQTPRSQAALNLSLFPVVDEELDVVCLSPSALASPEELTLDNMPEHIPALAGLSILSLLAHQMSGTVTLPYLPGMRIGVAVEMCQS